MPTLGLGLASAFLLAAVGSVEGPVTRVRDGDTIEVAGVAVRLEGVHAPERFEASGRDAAAFMADLVAGREVLCMLNGQRSHDRAVGVCFLAGRDVGASLVAAGLGRDCPRFSGGRYARFETNAGRRLDLPAYCTRRPA